MRPDLPPLRDVINQHGLRARRSLGQNFLLDLNLTARIARAAGNLSDTNVIEIGPGPGGLTRALLDTDAVKITALEMDFRAVAALEELKLAYPERLEIIETDAMKIDVASLTPAPRVIVANLPYNIATPLLLNWLRQIDQYKGLTLMFQKEVADRLCAAPRTKAYGRLSIIAQWLCHVSAAFNVDKSAFTPPPKITSTIVNFVPREKPLVDVNFKALETVTAAAFGQRRKMLRTSLKSLSLKPEDFGIPETARAEELSVEQFCQLARGYQDSQN